MNMFASPIPDQRIAYQPATKPKKASFEQRLNDAALRSEKSRTKREQHQAEIARLMELANGTRSSITQGQALEAKRLELGLRQVDFAAVLGLSKHHYSDVKAGRVALHLAALRRAFALGVDAGVLLAGNAEVWGGA